MDETKTPETEAKKPLQLECDTQSIYTPDPGEVEGPVLCGVCKTQMTEKKNCHGPRGWAMAMSGSKSYYDSFTCPHREEMWHRQVVALRNEAREAVSAKIAKTLLSEAKEVLATRKHTKEVSLFKGW